VEAVAESVGMKKAADNHFGFGVLAFDPAHIIAAGGFIVYIGHGVKVQPEADNSG